MVKVLDPASVALAQMAKAVNAVRAKEMSIRQAANSYGVDKSNLHRRVKNQVPINARPGPNPILTEGEVQGVIDAVDARTNRGQCFTSAELALFIREVVERSPYTREIPETFPSTSWAQRADVIGLSGKGVHRGECRSTLPES
ncbi:hypothetical protein ON010_g18928 [Phytophthora cinnamomi]|nr:hypothetical protein ON010_g18928 [Phytophthora cinnamomi]